MAKVSMGLSQDLIDDAVLWQSRFAATLMDQIYGQQMEFERSIGVFSDELWEYDKENDRILRERMEQHVKEILHG